jgi:hypothetical protein
MFGFIISNPRRIKIAIILCIVILFASVVYASVKLYVLRQRIDLSIVIINVFIFAIIAGIIIYLSKKQRDIEEDKLFS